MITLTTYAEARDAFRSRDLRQSLYDAGDRLMHGVIVNLHRDTFAWYERARIPNIIDAVLREPMAAGHGDLLPLARRTMMTLSMDVAGVDLPPSAEEFERVYGLMDDLARASTVAHAVGDTRAIIDAGDLALDAFDREFFEPSLRRRHALVEQFDRGEVADADLPRDVLTTLLRNQDRLDLTDATVLREIAYFPWVGSHSTSHQLVHAMHHMFEWMANDPSSRATLEHDDITRQRFVHESMRLHPASPVARRVAVGDVTLKSGRVLANGEQITISVHDANRDPIVFPGHPDRFDPYRELGDGVAPWGLSFGHGTHACLGQELAGGLEPDDALDHHLLGSVALMTGVVLRAGAQPDPDDPARLDATTTRVVWERYPVRFDADDPAAAAVHQ